MTRDQKLHFPSKRLVTPLHLRVTEADSEDIGRGVVRIPNEVLHLSGLRIGDLVKIIPNQGERTEFGAIVLPAIRDESERNFIQLNIFQRAILGVVLNDTVRVIRIRKTIAKKITIAPVSESTRLLLKEEALKRKFLSRTPSWEFSLAQGETRIILGFIRRNFTRPEVPSTNSTMEEVLDWITDTLALSPVMVPGGVRIFVASTEPEGIVLLDKSTKIDILPFPHIDFISKSQNRDNFRVLMTKPSLIVSKSPSKSSWSSWELLWPFFFLFLFIIILVLLL
ncbi:MAG: hypothetical protein ACW98F_17470 [Candidatus Hodarchaeales archaeon]